MTSSANRITGLATGLDIDSIVTATLKPYKTKIDTETQKKDTLALQQTMYRDVISSGRDLYNKYFDIGKSGNLLSSKTYATTKFTSSDTTGKVTATATGGAVKDTYTVNVASLATSASAQLSLSDFSSLTSGITIGSVTISKADLDAATTLQDKATLINSKISSQGLKASYSDFTKKVTVETTGTGSKTSSGATNTFTLTLDSTNATVTAGTDLKATISNSKGTVYYGYSEGDTLPSGSTVPSGANIDTSSDNSVTLDGVSFNISAATSGSDVTFTPSTDVTDVKAKIVSFINDYNTYIKKLNTLISDVHDRDYSPLTADQKKEMSETEITAWNEKVQKGQLHSDLDLIRIDSDLKSAVASTVIGATSSLKKIGITPVQDYDTSNGTFTIDEDTLTQALEENPDAVMQVFTKSTPTDTSLTTTQATAQTGIATRMKNILNNEFMLSSKSSLIQKAGYEGTSYFSQNTITKQISTYTTKIKQMNTDLSTREQNLYTKYSKLESLMSTYNSQSSQLQAMLGTS